MTVAEHDHRFHVFGTDVRVLVDPAQRMDALRVHALFRRLHRALTRFDAGSELGLLNARAGGDVVVSPMLLRAVDAALWAARSSDGLVDPTILDDLERAGYAGSRDGQAPAPLADALRAAPDRRPAAPRRPARWMDVAVDAAQNAIRLPAGVRLDLGGTAKGLSADLAAQLLARHSTFVVDAGGDMRIGGTHPAPRVVHIQHPLHDQVAHSFVVTAGAVATSGLRTRIWRTDHGYSHHLIDPGRGTPAWTGVIQATALAPTALEAETLAKTALLRGPRAGRELLARHGGALILDDGSVLLAGGLTANATRTAA
ncbi:MAG TPA: FAD:protein FMN transferase [Solirubrobacter sp.]|nr:FAD:protein FMN transferase [Solirubrobacter sp.]